MAEMLHSLVFLHPLAPPTPQLPTTDLREGRAVVQAGSTGGPHAHLLLVQGGGGDLAVDGSEVARLLLEQVVARGDRVLRVALRQRVRLVVVLAQDLLEVLHRLHVRLRVTPVAYTHRVSLEDVVAAAVVVVQIRRVRLLRVPALLVDLRNVGDVVGRPVALRLTRTSRSHVVVEERGHVLLDRQTGDLLHDPHHVLLLAVAVQVDRHPLPLTASRRAHLVVVRAAVVQSEDVHPRLRASRQHVAHLASLGVTPTIRGHDEGGHGLRHARLVQLVIVDGVRGLHRAQTELVHVKVILRVDEACRLPPLAATTRRGAERHDRLHLVVVEGVELVATQHGGVVSPGRVAHRDLAFLRHAHQRRALQVLRVLSVTPSVRRHLVAIGPVDVQKGLHVAVRVVHVHLTEGHLLAGGCSSVVSTVNVRDDHYPSVRPCSWVIIRPTYFQYCSSSFGGFATVNAAPRPSTDHLVDVGDLSVDVGVDSLRDRLSMEVDSLDVADVLPNALLVKISFQVARQ